MILQKMPFLRSRHDGTLVSPETLDSSSRSVNRPLALGHSLALFGVLAVVAAPFAAAAPKKLVGVQAWTSGSTTSIRSRPSADTPVVAKVARHMPIYVWGKYNGWYRVETHDHLFGWVHNPYISSPDLRKVVTMSAWKAKDASKRTDSQLVFGTTDQLKKFYIATGASGARKGLALRGIYVDSPKDLIPTRVASRKTAPQNRVAAKSPVVINVASAPRVSTQTSGGEVGSSENSSPLSSRLLTLRENALSSLPTTSVPQKVVVTSAPRPVAAVRSAPVQVAKIAPVAAKPVAKKAPAKVASTPKKAAPKKLTWSQKRWLAKAAAKQSQRDRLRAKVGLAAKPIAPAAVASLPVISPEQLLEARNAYLQSRQQRQMANAPLSPIGNVAPLPEVQLGGQIAPASPDRITPSSFNGSTNGGGFLLIDNSTAITSNQGNLVQTLVSNAQLKPAKPVVGNRGGSPRDRARINLGNGIANQALGYRGMRYVFGSANPRRGFDCSGLVYYMLRQRGYNPPRTAAGYRNYGSAVSRGSMQKGDLVLFANTYKRGISHIGVYLGNNNFVHAATSGSGVRVDSLAKGYFAKKFHSARRVQ